MRTGYSQNEEQDVITGYFAGSVGQFLDVGAFDGKLFSNTLRLAELGWSGIAVEPDPHAFCKLLDNYVRHSIQHVTPVHAFIGTEPGMVKFYGAGGDAISTASEESRRKWEPQTEFRQFFLPSITIRQLLDRFGAEFQMVSLDIEGMNLAVLQQMPMAEMKTSLICIEHDGHQYEIAARCRQHGLTVELLRNAENIILAKP